MSDRLEALGPDATRSEMRTAIDEATDLSRKP
jgi:hypothetical protein